MHQDNSLQKEQLRRVMREKRRTYPAAHAEDASLAAQRLLLDMPEFAAAQIVCCYIAMQGETATELVITACRKSGRTLLVPAFHPVLRDYKLAVFEPAQPLAYGPCRVPEPGAPVWTDLEPDFWVAPGLAFDSGGGRLGHGRGHYDRMFAAGNKPGFKVGLAFSWQIVGRAPMGPGDVCLDAVVTEADVFRRASTPETETYNRTAAPSAGGTAI